MRRLSSRIQLPKAGEEYNVKGKKIKETDPLGRETVYVYGTNNVPDPDPATGTGIDLLQVKQKNGAGYDVVASYNHNSQHLPLTITDAAGQPTTYTYLPDGRLQTVVSPPRAGLTATERTTTYAYYPDNAPMGAGQLQTITGPSTPQGSPVTSYTYDGYGRVRTVTDPDSYALTYDYDSLDRPTKTTYPDATYEETVYNRLDAERQRDRLGRWTHIFHDALRRVVAIRDPLGRTTTQHWCTCGSLDKLVDPNQNTRSWERDLQGRVTREVRADSSAIEVTYENTTSRVKQLKDPKNQIRGYEYFLDDRLKQVTYTNAERPTSNASVTYETSYARLQSMTDGTGTTTFGYHPITAPPQLGAGHLASIDGPLAGDTDKITLSYDELGRVVRREINGAANVTTQTFDALSRLTGETSVLGTISYAHDSVTGRPKTISYPAPNAQTTTFDYLDNLGDHRLKEIQHKRAGGANLSKFNYTTSAGGLLTGWTTQVDAAAATVFEYGYDSTDQITGAVLKTTGGTPSILKSYGYGYDNAGNRTVEAIDNSVVGTTYSAVNRLLSQQVGGALRFAGTVSEPATVTVAGQPAVVAADNRFAGAAGTSSGTNTVAVVATDPSGNARTNTYQVNVAGSVGSFTHDANGNLTSDGVRTYEWDAEDRLVAAVQGTRRSEFSYDGASRRVRIVEKDGATVLSDQRYLWCGLTICEERDAAGTTVMRRFFPQGMQEGTDAYFYTRDHLGSIRELTDNTGAVRARYEYDPYGRQTKVSGDKDSPFGFTGHFIHSPSGLLLAPYRPYSPSLGRWLTEDPIGLAGGGNLYAYVSNGPTNALDPTGEIAIALAGLFVAGIVLTAIVTAQIIRNPPQLPPIPPFTPTTTPPSTPPSGGGGGATTTTGGGGATTTTMSPPSNVVPFPGPKPQPTDCPTPPPGAPPKRKCYFVGMVQEFGEIFCQYDCRPGLVGFSSDVEGCPPIKEF